MSLRSWFRRCYCAGCLDLHTEIALLLLSMLIVSFVFVACHSWLLASIAALAVNVGARFAVSR